MSNPMSQFEVVNLFQISNGLSFTNASLFMLLGFAIISLTLYYGTKNMQIIPGKFQFVIEYIYSFIENTLISAAGGNAKNHVGFIISIFLFILVGNLLGMIPGSFTVTSHLSVTLAMAFITFIYVNVIAFKTHGLHFFTLFLPAGTPLWMAPLMIIIEIFAYLVRPFSLAVRLAANMIAGHTMLKVIAGLVLKNWFIAIFPFAFVIVLTGFEVFVAILQAYIFTVLSCVYLNDALNMH